MCVNMAAVQEPEVQFAQRLASNEKPVRTRAMKKLRKYISVRSQRDSGGFTGDELLKLWKGLFYCLWMQDKPLLQEELSNQISSLIHNFQSVDGQFLYLESFLQTFKREWTGIDRLRMDKFFQLVRFMFRQTFEMLKRKNWDSSVVGRFLELLTAQLLQSSSEAPSGLQFHILDLYMTELAAVGSEELTADQNLIFIEPFCKTAAKTKDGILFRAICSSIFSTIIDQAPFAIEDLMKEVKAAEASDSDSGQASEEDEGEEEGEEEQLKEKTTSKPGKKKKRTGKQINGKKSNEVEEEEDEDDYGDDDDDDDELLHLEDSDTEAPCDEDIGPVLQFDYAALADKLFELASRSNTPSQNRQRLYKIIKVLRDLSEGIFPQDEYPDEVSTDEDDDSFGSRKRMRKRGGGRTEEDEEGAPTSKKRKKKAHDKQNKDSTKDDDEPADPTANDENKKKKRKKKKKKKKAAGQGGGEDGENKAERCEQEEIVIKETEVSQTQSVTVTEAETLLVSEVKKQPSVTVVEETSQPTKKKKKSLNAEKNQEEAEGESQVNGVTTDAECPSIICEDSAEDGPTPAPEKPTDSTTPAKKKNKKKKLKTDEAAKVEADSEVKQEAKTQSSVSSVKVTEAETLLISEVKKQPSVTVTEETSQQTPSNEEPSEKVEPAGEQQIPEVSSDTDATVSGKKKKKKKGLKATLQTDEIVTESQVSVEAEITSVNSQETTPETDTTTPAKKKKKSLNAEKNLKELEAENGASTDADVSSIPCEDSAEDVPTAGDSTTPGKKKSKKKNLKVDEKAKVEAVVEVEGKQTDAELPSTGEEASPDSTAVPLKKKTKKKGKQEDSTLDAAADESSVTPLKKKKRKNNQKESAEEEGAAAAVEEASQVDVEEAPQVDAEKLPITMTTPAKKKKNKKLAAAQVEEIQDQTEVQVVGDDAEVVSSSEKTVRKKKRKIPVTFEFEADELEAAASINGLAEEETVVKKSKLVSDAGEPSTPLSSKKSQKKAKTPSGSTSDFITFQSNATVPTPLFCKTKGSLSTPLSSKKKSQTPKSESKKVTFGLKNNKTAEFRKTDRSLLVSPDGSSRVPFDPTQKPKFGVLKSPATPLSAGAKKTPKGPKKSSSSTPKSTPKRRPSAADFF